MRKNCYFSWLSPTIFCFPDFSGGCEPWIYIPAKYYVLIVRRSLRIVRRFYGWLVGFTIVALELQSGLSAKVWDFYGWGCHTTELWNHVQNDGRSSSLFSQSSIFFEFLTILEGTAWFPKTDFKFIWNNYWQRSGQCRQVCNLLANNSTKTLNALKHKIIQNILTANFFVKHQRKWLCCSQLS